MALTSTTSTSNGVTTKKFYSSVGGGKTQSEVTAERAKKSVSFVKVESADSKLKSGNSVRKKLVKGEQGNLIAIPDNDPVKQKTEAYQPKTITQSIMDKAKNLESNKSRFEDAQSEIQSANKAANDFNTWYSSNQPKTPTLDAFNQKIEKINSITESIKDLESKPNLSYVERQRFSKGYAEKQKLQEEAYALYGQAEAEYNAAQPFYTQAKHRTFLLGDKLADVKDDQAFVMGYSRELENFGRMVQNYNPPKGSTSEFLTVSPVGTKRVSGHALEQEIKDLESANAKLTALGAKIESNPLDANFVDFAKYNIGAKYVGARASQIQALAPKASKFEGRLDVALNKAQEGFATGAVLGGGIGLVVYGPVGAGAGALLTGSAGAVGSFTGYGIASAYTAIMPDFDLGVSYRNIQDFTDFGQIGRNAGYNVNKAFFGKETADKVFNQMQEMQYNIPIIGSTAKAWDDWRNSNFSREHSADIVNVAVAAFTGMQTAKAIQLGAAKIYDFGVNKGLIKVPELKQTAYFADYKYEVGTNPSRGDLTTFSKVTQGNKAGLMSTKSKTLAIDSSYKSWDSTIFKMNQKLLERHLTNYPATTPMNAQWNLPTDLVRAQAQAYYPYDPLSEWFAAGKQPFSLPDTSLYSDMLGRTYTTYEFGVGKIAFENNLWKLGSTGFEAKNALVAKSGLFKPTPQSFNYVTETASRVAVPYQSYQNFSFDLPKGTTSQMFGNQVIYHETDFGFFKNLTAGPKNYLSGSGQQIRDLQITAYPSGNQSGILNVQSSTTFGNKVVSFKGNVQLEGYVPKAVKPSFVQLPNQPSVWVDNRGMAMPGTMTKTIYNPSMQLQSVESIVSPAKTKLPVLEKTFIAPMNLSSAVSRLNAGSTILKSLPVAKVAALSAIKTQVLPVTKPINLSKQRLASMTASMVKPISMTNQLSLSKQLMAPLEKVSSLTTPMELTVSSVKTSTLTKPIEVVKPVEIESIAELPVLTIPTLPPTGFVPFGFPLPKYFTAPTGSSGRSRKSGRGLKKKSTKIGVVLKSDPLRKAAYGESNVRVTSKNVKLFKDLFNFSGVMMRMPTLEMMGGDVMPRKRTTRKRTTRRTTKRKTTRKRR